MTQRWQRDDFIDGIGLPLLRSGCLTGIALICAIAAVIHFRNGNAFFIVMLISIVLFWFLEKGRKQKQQKESEAMRRFLGIEDE